MHSLHAKGAGWLRVVCLCSRLSSAVLAAAAVAAAEAGVVPRAVVAAAVAAPLPRRRRRKKRRKRRKRRTRTWASRCLTKPTIKRNFVVPATCFHHPLFSCRLGTAVAGRDPFLCILRAL